MDIGSAARYQADVLESQTAGWNEDRLSDFASELRFAALEAVDAELDSAEPLADVAQTGPHVEPVDVEVNIEPPDHGANLPETPAIVDAQVPLVEQKECSGADGEVCNDARVIDNYEQPTAIASQRPTLPYSSNGRLVGTPHYGPKVVRVFKKPTSVVVIADDVQTPAEAVASASGCIIL